jgi:hypothetical protein
MMEGQAAIWRHSASAAERLLVSLAIEEVAFQVEVVVDVGVDRGELLK